MRSGFEFMGKDQVHCERFSFLLTLITCFLFVCLVHLSAVPTQFSYQGKVTDAVGVPIDGDTAMVFKLYADDSLVWTESYDGQSGRPYVSVSQGHFSLQLGSIVPLDSTLFSSNNMTLGITIGTDDEMEPRVTLLSTPFAFQADRIDSLDSSQFLRSDIGDTVSGSMTFLSPTSFQDKLGVFSNQTGAWATEIVQSHSSGYGLIVSGNVGSNPLLSVGDGLSTPLFVVLGTGHVGVGLSDPSVELEVEGTVSANVFEGTTISLLRTSIDAKVDKESGKGLSSEDFTAALKTKLEGIESGAKSSFDALSGTPNVAYTATIPADQFSVSEVSQLKLGRLSDGTTTENLVDRSNHTGEQSMSTVTNLIASLNSKIEVNGSNQLPAVDGSLLYGLDFRWEATGDDVYRLTGNVGLGTNSPSEMLEVLGNIVASKVMDRENTSYYSDLSGTTVMNNTYIGGTTSAGTGDLYLADRLYDWDNTSYYADLTGSTYMYNMYVGGTSASGGGDLYVADNIYDWDNTGYYANLSATSRMYSLYVGGTSASGAGDLYVSDKLYDWDDTYYHLDPNYESSLYRLKVVMDSHSNNKSPGSDTLMYMQRRGDGLDAYLEFNTYGSTGNDQGLLFSDSQDSSGKIYFTAQNSNNTLETIRIHLNGTDIFNVYGTGVVGIGAGIATPNAELEVSGNVYLERVYDRDDLSYFLDANGTSELSRLQVGTTGRFYSSATGQGETHEASGVQLIPGTAQTTSVFEHTVGESAGIAFNEDSAVIWSAGNGDRLLSIKDEDGMVERAYINANGAYVKVSDARLKGDVQTVENALSNILKIRGVRYHFLNSDPKEMSSEIGVIAQEVEPVFPDLVYTDPYSGYRSVSYDEFSGIFIEAIKELKAQKDAEVDDLKQELATVKKELETARADRRALTIELESLSKKLDAL